MAYVHLSTAAQNAAADAIVDLIDAGSGAQGYLRIYKGTVPTNANTAITSEATNRLSDHNFVAKATGAFGDSSSGIVTANAIADDTSADNGGEAEFARIYDTDGNTIMDIDVGTAAATLIINTTTIVAGSTVSIDSGQFTMPAA